MWAQGISGDVPIVLVRIDEVEDSGIVRELLRAREYWRLKGLAVDLVILNERGASYVQDLQIALETLVRTSRSRTHLGAEGERGGIFVLRSDLISAETRALLLAVARVVLLSRRGGLADQLNRVQTPRGVLPPAKRQPPTDAGPLATPPPVTALAALQFFNGLGGFSPNGREYVTVLGPGQSTPAPWINVVSNPSFGFQVAAEGGGYTWSQNSRDNQLTPWSNDPVSDRPGEVLYVRDLDSGALWTPTALPIRLEQAPYIVRHGRGYSRFEVVAQGIALELLQYVPLADSDQDLAAHHPQRLRPAAAAVGHGLRRMGARPVARRVGADGRHRARRRDRRDLRAQSLEHASRHARGLRRSGRSPDGVDRRPQRVHRPQLHASTIPPR